MDRSRYSLWLLVLSGTMHAGCGGSQAQRPFLGYNLSSPMETYQLPKELVEVSGAAYWKEDQMALVQDEDDIVFIYDTQKKKVVDEVKFHKDGDHEGIASDGEKLFVVRSDGHLFQLDDLKGDKTGSEHMNNGLSAKNDVEGLCYDRRSGDFLLACKGDPGEGMKSKEQRAVWAFNIKKEKLSRKPFLVIEKSEINALLTKHAGKKVKREFAPSAIEIHPISGDIWMVAAQGNVLVVYNSKGELLDATILSSIMYRQPEALTFDPAGDLFIANEGGEHKARMYRFTMIIAKE